MSNGMTVFAVAVGGLMVALALAFVVFRVILGGAVTLRQQRRMLDAGASQTEVQRRARTSFKIVVGALGVALLGLYVIAAATGIAG